MKHASTGALRQIAPLLAELRALPDLKEKSAGAFYRGSSAFLHFHEDPAGLFADVRLGEDFERYRVSTLAEQERVLELVLVWAGGLRGHA